MFGVVLIFLVAFAMEALGTYTSIIGLGALFANDAVVLGLAAVLDAAKLTTVSFLYQCWKDINRLMKAYMLVASLVLITITSAGAFGYLSGAFQKAIQPNRETLLKVESLKKEEVRLTEERVGLLAQKTKLDEQVNRVADDKLRGKRQLIAAFKPEQDRLNQRLDTVTKRIDELTTERLKVESESIERDVHIGPISYVSKAFGVSMEDASKYIILTIVAVFDPLAIALVLAGNFLVKRRRERPAPAVEPAEQEDVDEPFKMTPAMAEGHQLLAELGAKRRAAEAEREAARQRELDPWFKPEPKPTWTLPPAPRSELDQTETNLTIPPLDSPMVDEALITDMIAEAERANENDELFGRVREEIERLTPEELEQLVAQSKQPQPLELETVEANPADLDPTRTTSKLRFFYK